MSELIAQHCSLFEQWKENGTYNQDREDILNDLQTELTRLQSTDITVFRQQIEKITNYFCDNILVLNEKILTFLFDYLVQLMKQWCQSPTNFNNENDINTFKNLGKFFEQYSNTLTHESVDQEFIQCLFTIARIGKPMFVHSNIQTITSMIKKYKNVQSSQGVCFMAPSQIDDGVIKCLCSSYTPEVFTQLKSSSQSEERTLSEEFVFDGLFIYMKLINRQRLEENSLELRRHLLNSISDLLDDFVQASDQWSISAKAILEEVTILFLYSVQMTLPNDECLDTQKHICDTAIRILLLPECQSMRININCAQYIYIGTLNDKILDYLKNQKLAQTMFQIGHLYKNESDIQFNIYRILAAIMTEDDIKRLDDPGTIAGVFLNQLDQIKDLNGWETRIKNLLTSLKILLQHDQLRDEIYKLNGLTLFVYCATQSKYDALLQQRALENLLIMAFDEKVRLNLKENNSFMTYLESLSQNSNESDLKRAAESLLWILTKEETSSESLDEQTAEKIYDIMISYSHKDQDLCFQLYDRLTKDNFRVWLDRDQMHGTPLESMSNAIENAEFVFVCMSDAYKQSGYCKMEAYYALERQCCIIPLVMKAQYKADGWLGIVVTGRMRIDFPKYGFEDAYSKLITEINRHRKEKKKPNQTHYHHEPPSVTKPSDNVITQPEKKPEKLTFQAKSDYRLPSDIQQWSVEDVQQFLLRQHLECFLSICQKMNGTRLVSLYQMCTVNSPVMFQSLNNQLTVKNSEEHTHLIEICEYLQFLEDLKPLVPVLVEKKEATAPSSSVCTLL